MVLSIETEEVDALARRLAHLTGETTTEAITVALRERLAREEKRRNADADLPARVGTLTARLRKAYDTRPVTRAEWDAAGGDV